MDGWEEVIPDSVVDFLDESSDDESEYSDSDWSGDESDDDTNGLNIDDVSEETLARIERIRQHWENVEDKKLGAGVEARIAEEAAKAEAKRLEKKRAKEEKKSVKEKKRMERSMKRPAGDTKSRAEEKKARLEERMTGEKEGKIPEVAEGPTPPKPAAVVPPESFPKEKVAGGGGNNNQKSEEEKKKDPKSHSSHLPVTPAPVRQGPTESTPAARPATRASSQPEKAKKPVTKFSIWMDEQAELDKLRQKQEKVMEQKRKEEERRSYADAAKGKNLPSKSSNKTPQKSDAEKKRKSESKSETKKPQSSPSRKVMKGEASSSKPRQDKKRSEVKQPKGAQQVWDEALEEEIKKTEEEVKKTSQKPEQKPKRKRVESDRKVDPKGLLDESDNEHGRKN